MNLGAKWANKSSWEECEWETNGKMLERRIQWIWLYWKWQRQKEIKASRSFNLQGQRVKYQ